jgi:phytanoyl-CoA hydroxylase
MAQSKALTMALIEVSRGNQMADTGGFFQTHGYYIARGLFSSDEVAALRDHFMMLNAQRTTKDTGLPPTGDDKPDPLLVYQRMLHMHRWDQRSLDFLLDSRLRDLMTEMLGTEPYAAQTMIYFKPPGARGQALHQDQFYLKVQPGTCMAAWLAMDDCDEENGCMQVVDGSHTWDVLCTVKADTRESFTDVTVPLPEGVTPTPVLMKAGDVMFFNGQLVHGSYPNRTTDRFRRALIAHYIVGDAEQVAVYYHPIGTARRSSS